ncbi:hypothetical protein FRC08_007745 [Ceratobasidium sp. 394]|nr:hypothetical protein FRC08_007745 [Ceratobasidium sp. 394]
MPGAPRISHAVPMPYLGTVVVPPISTVPASLPISSAVGASLSASRSQVVSHNREDHHDDYIVETMLNAERSPASASDVAPMPPISPSTSHNSPTIPNNFDVTEDDCCSINSDATTQEDFYAAQDRLYAAHCGSYVSQSGFYATRENHYPTRNGFYVAQGSFSAPRSAVHATEDVRSTIPNMLDPTSHGSNPNTSPALANEHVSSGAVWK